VAWMLNGPGVEVVRGVGFCAGALLGAAVPPQAASTRVPRRQSVQATRRVDVHAPSVRLGELVIGSIPLWRSSRTMRAVEGRSWQEAGPTSCPAAGTSLTPHAADPGRGPEPSG